MHGALVASGGHMPWWFGMDFSTSPLSGHGFPKILPYLALMAIAVFLQYFQMKQMNSRKPQAAAANPQMQTMQKIFPNCLWRYLPKGASGSNHLHGCVFSNADPDSGSDVPIRHGDSGHGRT